MKTYLKYLNEANYKQTTVRKRPGLWVTLPADVVITGKNIGKLDVKVSFKGRSEKEFNKKIIEFLKNEFKRKYKFILADDASYDIMTVGLDKISFSFVSKKWNVKKDINDKKSIDLKIGLMSFVDIEITDDDDALQIEFEVPISSEDIIQSIKKSLGIDYNTIKIGESKLTSKGIDAFVSVEFEKD